MNKSELDLASSYKDAKLVELEASNKEVWEELESVDYRGSLADGVRYLKVEAERLNTLVAMQAEALALSKYTVGAFCRASDDSVKKCFESLCTVVSATAETVSAYQNEVKAKALEEASDWFVKYGPPDTQIETDDAAARELRRMASELRAKGE